jgi:hypothetical protein
MDAPGGLCAAEALPVAAGATGEARAAAAVEVAVAGLETTVEEAKEVDYSSLSDAEIVALVRGGSLKDHLLEAKLKDAARAGRRFESVYGGCN